MGQPSNPLCAECAEGGATTCDHLDEAIDQINRSGGTANEKLDKAIDVARGRRGSNGRRR